MAGVFPMAFKTWKPITAAFEFYGDDVNRFAIMFAAGLRVNVRAFYLYLVDQHKNSI
jgi:hypothetical protein